MRSQRGFAHLVALVTITVITISMIGVMAWFRYVVNREVTNGNTNINGFNTNTTLNINIVANTNNVTNTATDVTTGWGTYSNDTYGYSLRYPDTYASSGTNESHKLQMGNLAGDPTAIVTIDIYTDFIPGAAPGQDVYSWARYGFQHDVQVEKYHENPREVTLGGTTFIKTDGDVASTQTPEYFLFQEGILYVLYDFRTGAVDDTNEDIIGTFQLTQTNWLTYINSTVGYQIKYPPGYVVRGSGNSVGIGISELQKGRVASLSIYFSDGNNDSELKTDNFTGDPTEVLDFINNARSGFLSNESLYLANRHITTIGGRQFITYDYDAASSAGSRQYYLISSSGVLFISDYPGGAGNIQGIGVREGTLLSTFQFTE